MNAVTSYWQSRNDVQRSTMTRAAIGVGLAVFVAQLWLPMHYESRSLERDLPARRAATATMQRQATQVAVLRAAPPRSTATAPPLASVATALAQALPGAQVTALDERRLRVAANDLAWGTLLEWIADARARHWLDVTGARIEALAMTGRVKVDLTLERP